MQKYNKTASDLFLTIKKLVNLSSQHFISNFSKSYPDTDMIREDPPLKQITETSNKISDDIIKLTSDKKNNYLTWIHNYTKNKKHSFADDYHNLSSFLSGKQRIVDAGASPFILSAMLKDAGHEIIPLDIEPGRHKTVTDFLGLHPLQCRLDVNRWPVESNSCSIVIMNNVFEHLQNPLHAMKNINRILKKNGLFTMTTPNLGSLSGIVNFYIFNKAQALSTDIFSEYSKFEQIGHMGHVREYTITEICEIAKMTGFKTEKISFSGPQKTLVPFKKTNYLNIDLKNIHPHLLLKARYFFKKAV